MVAYYNEHDPYAAAWLRNLVSAGLIAPGDVDERDVQDVKPAELLGYTQCHFFAGIGGWSYALRLAGFPDDRHVWTASLPCQPFSAAGKGAGLADERHLWPAFNHLRECCEPTLLMGEQVASPDGLAWWDVVCDDLEDAGYAAWASDLCAAGVGAPHIRQRLWWVAYAGCSGWREQRRIDAIQRPLSSPEWSKGSSEPRPSCNADGMVVSNGRDSGSEGLQRGREYGQFEGNGSFADGLADAMPAGRPEGWARSGSGQATGSGGAGGLAHASSTRHFGGRSGEAGNGIRASRIKPERLLHASQGHASPLNGLWRDADWLLCRDGKWRPVEPGTSPLASGVPSRVGKLRAYGNAICAPLAAQMIGQWMEVFEGLGDRELYTNGLV